MTTRTDETAVAPIVRAVAVHADQATAFAVFTERIGDWWPLATHTPAETLSRGLEFRDGILVELQSTGAEQVWGTVTGWEPPGRLAFDWRPSGGPTTQVVVDFEPVDGGTRVVLTHSGWEAYGDGARSMHDTYGEPSAWRLVLDLFAACVSTGRGARAGGHDAQPLREGYDAVARALLTGPFGRPRPGQWNARQVAGHVCTNAELMVAVVDDVTAGRPARLHGPEDHAPRAIGRFDDATLESASTALQFAGAHLVARCATLTADDLETPVSTYIEHEGETVVDQALPLGALLDAQASQHLPAHIQQIADLREPS